jgi:hypothetical protein
MPHHRERIWLLAVAAVVLVLIIGPYLYAWLAAGEAQAFGGLLVNHLDGNSYLAKMRQGYNGAWTFTLPYTAEPGEGAAINLYYLFLGHLARWTGASLIFMNHAARVLGAIVLMAALWRFCLAIFSQRRSALSAYTLAALGGGLGWVALLAGAISPDLRVAEAYPFLASFTNAHFPLGLALQVILLTPLRSIEPLSPRHMLGLAAAALLLAIVYPFGLVVAGATLALHLALRAWRRLPLGAEMQHLAAVAIGGLPYAGYALRVVTQHPVLSQWNAQNITPAPTPLDMLWGFVPAALVAGLGAYVAWRRGQTPATMLLHWVVVSLVLIYLPLGLQRRLISGLFIPVAALAVLGLEAITRDWRRWAWSFVLLLALSLPSPLLVMIGSALAAPEQETYISADEIAAYNWLDEHAASDALVLTDAASGNRLPAYIDVRVLYGHPFETVESEARLDDLTAFWAGERSARELGADYVLYIGQLDTEALNVVGALVFKQGDTRIWSVNTD